MLFLGLFHQAFNGVDVAARIADSPEANMNWLFTAFIASSFNENTQLNERSTSLSR